MGSDDVFCAYDAIHGVQFVAAHEGTPVFVSALNFKWATLFYLSIRSLFELRLHPVPNWGQARLMRLGQTGMSVKLLSLGKGLVQGQQGESVRPGDADHSTAVLILQALGLCMCACVRRCVRTDRITPCLIHSALSPSASPNDIETEY